MLGQIVQAQGLRVAHQLPKDPVPLGQGSDALDLIGLEADIDELDELAAIPDHTECPVAGGDQLDRDLDDPTQHAGQVELTSHCDGGLEEALQSLGWGLKRGLIHVRTLAQGDATGTKVPRTRAPGL